MAEGSLLQTLYILFKSNSEDVKKGAKDAKEHTSKLQTSLQDTEKGTNRLGDSFTEIASKFGDVIAGFVSAAGVIESLKSAGEYSKQIHELSEQTLVSAQNLDTWGRVVTNVGGSAQGFQGTIIKLSSIFAQAKAYGGEGSASLAQAVGKYGQAVSVRDNRGNLKDPIQFLKDLAPLMERIGSVKAKALGEAIGLDPGTIFALEKGPKALQAMLDFQKKLGTETAASGHAVLIFAKSWNDVGAATRTFFRNINTTSLPILASGLDKIVKIIMYVNDHAEATKGALLGIGLAITAYLIPALAGLAIAMATSGIGGFILAVGALAAGFSYAYVHAKQLSDLLDRTFGKVEERRNKLSNITKGILNDVGLGFLLPNKTDVTHSIKAAQSQLHVAQSAIIPASSHNISNMRKNISISTGAINIVTQATDATGIAREVGKSLIDQMRQAAGAFDNAILG